MWENPATGNRNISQARLQPYQKPVSASSFGHDSGELFLFVPIHCQHGRTGLNSPRSTTAKPYGIILARPALSFFQSQNHARTAQNRKHSHHWLWHYWHYARIQYPQPTFPTFRPRARSAYRMLGCDRTKWRAYKVRRLS